MKRRILSTGRPRAEIISEYAYGADRAYESPFPDGPGRVDQGTLAAAAAPPAETDKGYQPAPYKPDPDETVECPNCGKFDDEDAAYCDQCGFQLEGSEDIGGEADSAAHAVETPKAPVDEEGNVDGQIKCANADCGHLALSHLDEDTGKNTGACSEMDCSCLAMQVASEPNTDSGDKGEGETQPKESASLAAAPVEGEPTETEPDTPELNLPPETEGGESMGPAFTIPVLIIEGQPTGDGREIAPGALTWRTPPIPLMGLDTETHDPEGWDLNDPAVMVGRIDSLERQPGEGNTQIISAKGFFLPNEDGMHFAELTEAMGRLGVSGDVAVESSKITVEDIDEVGMPTDMTDQLLEGKIMGATCCPFPAFEGAYIVLGDGSEQPDAQIPQQPTETPDAPPEAVTAGGQLIHWMTYEECEPCDQGFEVIVAAGAGPARPPSAWFADPGFTEGDGRLEEILGRDGQREDKYACPVTVTDDGRVFGHIAPWGVCHTAHTGKCVLAPHSAADYAHFKRGQHVLTAEGEKVRVGVLTCDTGHASTRPGFSMVEAMAHYDNTALAVADVNIGEDEYGIWVAGAIRADATEEQIRKLRASSISGDWRAAGGQLELVAALAVNQPGFPLAVVAGGQVESLVAAGVNVMAHLKQPAERVAPDSETMWQALKPLLADARDRARDRIAPLRA